jgi:hypothetical protein
MVTEDISVLTMSIYVLLLTYEGKVKLHKTAETTNFFTQAL